MESTRRISSQVEGQSGEGSRGKMSRREQNVVNWDKDSHRPMFYTSTVILFYGFTVLWLYSSAVPRFYSFRFHSSTVLQFYSSTVLQFYSSTVLQFYGSTGLHVCKSPGLVRRGAKADPMMRLARLYKNRHKMCVHPTNLVFLASPRLRRRSENATWADRRRSPTRKPANRECSRQAPELLGPRTDGPVARRLARIDDRVFARL
ncbi:unnamed protein product [Protopolystoma xenopodis]|uniref:Uncharacterized protein n=1 Tax=Protopolystoma xenopodis TaxID=117903 RepID=A0A448XNZ4_9PLAT|nr:unnamed protein product [Protopolystoma xenopodis]